MANQNQNQNVPSNEQFISEPVEVGLPWRLMIFTFVLFLFSIFIFIGLRFGYVTYLNNQIEATDKKMENLAAQVSEGEKEKFLTFYSQLVNLKEVLNRRQFSQNIFSLMEGETLGSVYYTSAEYNKNRMNLVLSGRAESMQDFVNQMSIYSNSDSVSQSVLNNISTEEGEVDFSVNLLLNPEFLNKI